MPRNDESILESIKQVLQIEPGYDVYDLDILMHINTGFTELWQLGVGDLNEAFYVEDKDTKWSAFIGDIPNIQSVKTYMSMYVRLKFDPPSTSYAIAAMERQLEEIKFRLNITETAPAGYLPPILGGFYVES